MKKLIFAAATVATLASCGSQKPFLEAFAPEESALNLVKITDEGNNVVMGPTMVYYADANGACGICSTTRTAWSTPKLLDLSPDGKKLAYVTRMNKQDNIMVRSTASQGVATQRTFRDVSSFAWGRDNNLYFADINGTNSYVCSVNADAGSMMKQHTSGTVRDFGPAVSTDGALIFFTRFTQGAPSIWSLDKSNGTLTSCARGYNPCVIPGRTDAFYCVRNNTNGRSEIWFVDFVKGEESLILSDVNRSFTNPVLSPDGKWIACVGNAKSSISGKDNLDIFVVKTDGSNLTQLTYHPNADTCPVWSRDGRSLFFLSTRANKTQSYNVWRMNFNME